MYTHVEDQLIDKEANMSIPLSDSNERIEMFSYTLPKAYMDDKCANRNSITVLKNIFQ